jgi:hypothetical protein
MSECVCECVYEPKSQYKNTDIPIQIQIQMHQSIDQCKYQYKYHSKGGVGSTGRVGSKGRVRAQNSWGLLRSSTKVEGHVALSVLSPI